MKKVLLLSVAMFVAAMFGVSSSAVAAEKMKMASKGMEMTGTIIDTKCATANEATLGEFVKTHPKECAMAPDCHKSGYNLYSDGKLYKFDKKSSDKVYKFLEKADSKLNVKVEVMHGKGDMLKLVKIENAM